MELPKRGTSMAPLVTKTGPPIDLMINKKVRYEAQFKDEGVLLQPKDFKVWRNKLDKLKQVVRVAHPCEISIHQSKFTMSKRRAQTLDRKQSRKEPASAAAEQIQTECVNLDESLLSAADGADTDGQVTQNVTQREETDADEQNGLPDKLPQTQLMSQAEEDVSSTPMAKVTEERDRERETTNQSQSKQQYQTSKDASTMQKPSLSSAAANVVIEQTRIQTEESCLGYLYPKRVDAGQKKVQTQYGSKLGPLGQAAQEQQRNMQGRVPQASNLESLMTYPKKIHSKSGALLGFSNVKYPKSFYEEIREAQKQELAQANIKSPSLRRQPTRQASQLSEDILRSVRDSHNAKMASEQHLRHDPTPKESEALSTVVGWESGQLTSEGPSGPMSAVLQSSTRVGGATFVKNVGSTGASQATLREEKQVTTQPESQTRHTKTKTKGRHNTMSQPAMKARKKSISYGGEERLKRRYHGASGISSTEHILEHQTPLQLANLNVLMANLEKTGNFQLANEEAYRLQKLKNKKATLNKLKQTSLMVMNPAANIDQQRLNRTGYGDTLEATSFYKAATSTQNNAQQNLGFLVTDDKGNPMKISRSTIFEMTSDNQFNTSHQMGPKFGEQLTQFAQTQSKQGDGGAEDQAFIARKAKYQSKSPKQIAYQNGQALSQYNNSSMSQYTSAFLEGPKGNQILPFRYGSQQAALAQVSGEEFTSLNQVSAVGTLPPVRGYSTTNGSATLASPPGHKTVENQSRLGAASSFEHPQSALNMAHPPLQGRHQQSNWRLQKNVAAIQGAWNEARAGPEQMMVTGGHAMIKTKQGVLHNQSQNKSETKRFLQADPNKQSNQDLNNLDPTLTLMSGSLSQILPGGALPTNQAQSPHTLLNKSPKTTTALARVAPIVPRGRFESGDVSQSDNNFGREMNAANGNLSHSRSPKRDKAKAAAGGAATKQQSARHSKNQLVEWQVLTSSKQDQIFDYAGADRSVSNGFTLGRDTTLTVSAQAVALQMKRASSTDSHRRVTDASRSSSHKRMGAVVDPYSHLPMSAKGSIMLPTMLQNMKNQLNSQASRRVTPEHANYGVVGRSVSPALSGTRFDNSAHRRGGPIGAQTRNASIQYSNQDDLRNNNVHESSSRGHQSGKTAAFAQGASANATSVSNAIKSIVVQQTRDVPGLNSGRGGIGGGNDTDIMTPDASAGQVTGQTTTDQAIKDMQQSDELGAMMKMPEVLKVDQIVNVKSGKKLKHGNMHSKSNKKRNSKLAQQEGTMNLEGAVASSGNDFYSVMGEQAINALKGVYEGKSRDRLAMQGDTIKLEAASYDNITHVSTDQLMDASQINFTEVTKRQVTLAEEVVAAYSHETQQPQQQRLATQVDQSPQMVVESNRSEEAQRHIVPIQKPSQDEETTPQAASHVSLENTSQKMQSIGNLHQISSRKEFIAQAAYNQEKQRMGEGMSPQTETEQEQNDQVQHVYQQADFVFLKADSSDDLLSNLQGFNALQPTASMQVTLGGEPVDEPVGKGSKAKSMQRANSKIQGSSKAFTGKRGTNESQKRGIKQQAMINTTISSVNIGNQQQVRGGDSRDGSMSPKTTQSKFFLPTMPFKQSSFARTQKAIRMIRQGPLNRRMRQENLSGQFMKLNDYAAMHGMYLKPEESAASGLDSTMLASDPKLIDSGPYQRSSDLAGQRAHWNMTQTVKSTSNQSGVHAPGSSIDNINHVTATSFGHLIKNRDSLSKPPVLRSQPGSAGQDPSTAEKGDTMQGADGQKQEVSQDYDDSVPVRHVAKEPHPLTTSEHDSSIEQQHLTATGNHTQLTTANLQRQGSALATEERPTDPSLRHSPLIGGNVSTQTNQSRQQAFAMHAKGEGTALLSDYIMTQRQNENGITVRTEGSGKDLSTHLPKQEAQKPGQITIKRNSQSYSNNQDEQQSLQGRRQSSSNSQGAEGPKSRHFGKTSSSFVAQMGPASKMASQSRQVVVHKLTMAAPQTGFSRGRGEVDSPGRRLQGRVPPVGLGNLSPKVSRAASNRDEHNFFNSKEASVTEQTSNWMRQSAHSIKGAKFGPAAATSTVNATQKQKGKSQKVMAPIASNQLSNASQSRQSIINFGATPFHSQLTLDVQNQNNKNQNYATPFAFGDTAHNNSQNFQAMVSSTASKFMTNTEAKARQFIEKQRKRTATLGAQRQNQTLRQQPYKVPTAMQSSHEIQVPIAKAKSKSPPKQRAAQPKDAEYEGQEGEDAGGPTMYTGPPIIDFNGDSLYESGLTIRQAQVSQGHQSQARYLQNRRTAQNSSKNLPPSVSNSQVPSMSDLNKADTIAQAAAIKAEGLRPSATPQNRTQDIGAASREKSLNNSTEMLPSQFTVTTSQIGLAPGDLQKVINNNLHKNAAALSRINHQQLNVTNQRQLQTNPQPTGKQQKKATSKSPPNHRTPRVEPASITQQATRNSLPEQLRLTCNVIASQQRAKDGSSKIVIQADESQKYEDYLRGNTDLGDTSTVRAKTPGVELSALKAEHQSTVTSMMLIKQKSQQQGATDAKTVKHRSGVRHGTKQQALLSNDTLQLIGQKSHIAGSETSDPAHILQQSHKSNTKRNN